MLKQLPWVLFCLVLFLCRMNAQAAIVNVTVDDQNGDEVTGRKPTYSAHFSQGNGCTKCLIKPDPSLAFDGTWHDSTYKPTQSPSTVTISFNGIAVYAFFLVANNNPSTVTVTNLSFTLDGQLAGSFEHEPTDADTIIGNVLGFQNTGLSNTEHTLVIAANGVESSVMLFDYLMYSTDAEQSATDTLVEIRSLSSTAVHNIDTSETASETIPATSETTPETTVTAQAEIAPTTTVTAEDSPDPPAMTIDTIPYSRQQTTKTAASSGSPPTNAINTTPSVSRITPIPSASGANVQSGLAHDKKINKTVAGVLAAILSLFLIAVIAACIYRRRLRLCILMPTFLSKRERRIEPYSTPSNWEDQKLEELDYPFPTLPYRTSFIDPRKAIATDRPRIDAHQAQFSAGTLRTDTDIHVSPTSTLPPMLVARGGLEAERDLPPLPSNQKMLWRQMRIPERIRHKALQVINRFRTRGSRQSLAHKPEMSSQGSANIGKGQSERASSVRGDVNYARRSSPYSGNNGSVSPTVGSSFEPSQSGDGGEGSADSETHRGSTDDGERSQDADMGLNTGTLLSRIAELESEVVLLQINRRDFDRMRESNGETESLPSYNAVR